MNLQGRDSLPIDSRVGVLRIESSPIILFPGGRPGPLLGE